MLGEVFFMSVKELLDTEMEDRDLTYVDLAKALNMPLKTIYNIRTSRVEMPSRKFLKKLSDYLKENPYLIVYKSLLSRNISRNLDETSLMYLCKKYGQGLGIEIRNRENDFLFCGAHYKLRTFNSYSLVDGWKYLEFQFWNEQFGIFDFDSSMMNESYPKDIFLNDDIYYKAILQYGISKVQHFDLHKVINYDLTFQDEEIYNRIQKLLPTNKLGFNLNLVLESVPDSLNYNQSVFVDNEDLSFFSKIYTYALAQYFHFSDKPSTDLWIAAFEGDIEVIPYVQPNIGYARSKLIRNDYDLLMENENRKCSPEERLIKYLRKKINCLKNGERDKVDLNYLDYQYVLRPIDATLHQGKTSCGDFKKILKALKPLIEDYYKNIEEEVAVYPFLL